TWRPVLNRPDAAPVIAGLMSRRATVIDGAVRKAIPTPATMNGSAKVGQVAVVLETRAKLTSPRPYNREPSVSTKRQPIRSVTRPAIGAPTASDSAKGSVVSPALTADMPRTDWK